VSDGAEIARAVAKQGLEQPISGCRPQQVHHGSVGAWRVPLLQGEPEGPFRLRGRRDRALGQRAQRPEAVSLLCRLGRLEDIRGPQDRQPAVVRPPKERGAVHRMQHHEGVVLVTHLRVGAHLACRRFRERAQERRVVETRANRRHQLLDQAIPIGLDQQPNQATVARLRRRGTGHGEQPRRTECGGCRRCGF
jgi:hypothetical protein